MTENRKNYRAVIPSLFTIANMAFGFFSILAAGDSDYVRASWFIIFAILMDMMDGRVARLVRGESPFGVEIDSLSDWISFGVAPSYLLYAFALKSYGIWGYPVALFYLICGALRLARFNVKAHHKAEEDKKNRKFFQGLPIPGAAGILVSFVLVYSMMEVDSGAGSLAWVINRMPFIYGALPFFIIAVSLLMISNVPYGAFKGFNVFKPKSIPVLFFIIICVFFIIAYPRNSLFLFFSLYVLSGIVLMVFRLLLSLRGGRGLD